MKAVNTRRIEFHAKHTLDIFDQHHLERRQSICTVIATKTCIKSERKLGIWGLYPQEILLRPHPLERRKTPFCKVGYNLFSFLIFMPKRKADLIICFHRGLMTKNSIGKSYANIKLSAIGITALPICCPLPVCQNLNKQSHSSRGGAREGLGEL